MPRNQDDQFSQEDISDLISGGDSYTSGHGQLTLSTAWQALIGTPPTDNYVLVVAKETVTGTVRFSYSNSGDPTDEDSPKIETDGFVIVVPGGLSIYLGSSNATDTVNYSYRTLI